MQDFGHSFWLAGSLIAQATPELREIVGLSLTVTLSAVAIACFVGLPLGALLAVVRFPGRMAVILFFNTLMGLPPVVVGLLVYMMLSNAGPLGFLQLLYTPAAMIIAQAVLVTPLIIALTRQVIEELYLEYEEQFCSLVVPRKTAVVALLWDARCHNILHARDFRRVVRGPNDDEVIIHHIKALNTPAFCDKFFFRRLGMHQQHIAIAVFRILDGLPRSHRNHTYLHARFGGEFWQNIIKQSGILR